MKQTFCFLLIFASVTLNAQNIIYKADALVTPRIREKVLTVGGPGADLPGFSSQTIQFAIDAVAQTGGTVQLTAGKFDIITPVRLKSNVKLTGEGRETILNRVAGHRTRFIDDADYGELKLVVEDPSGFEPGMKVQVTDKQNSSCWNVSTAYITEVIDNVIYVDKGMIRDYRSDIDGYVTSSSSVIDIMDAENVLVSNLVADGNRSENFFTDGCNNAGIMVMRSKNITIDNVHVKDFNGEGISWQITEHVTVRNSEISGSGNTGLHPGTGSPHSLIENNEVHGNDRDGLFICWRVYQSNVLNNRFHSNGRYGICTGHKDTDVLFRGNHIYDNGSDGINLRGERESNAPHRNTFENNIIENNGTRDGGYGFHVNSPARDLVLRGNTFRSAGRQTQKAAIFISQNGLMPLLENNRIEKHPEGEVIAVKKENE